MKSNREIRREAKRILSDGWAGRSLIGGVLLYAVVTELCGAVLAVCGRLDAQTWFDFLASKLEHARSGLCYTVPSSSAFWRMTGATAFQQFIVFLFGAILLYGLSCFSLNAARNDSRRWLAAAFSGFARPLEATWLLVLINLRVFLWSLLFLVPGAVAVYRYRLAWYLKCEHGDWSAWRCLGESGRIMRGFKWQAFRLDVSYLAVATFAWLGIECAIVAVVGGVSDWWLVSAVVAVAAVAIAVPLVYVLAITMIRFFTARAVFYRAVHARACAHARENLV